MFNFFTNSDIPKLIIGPSDYFMGFVRSFSFDRVDFLPIFCMLRLKKVVSLSSPHLPWNNFGKLCLLILA